MNKSIPQLSSEEEKEEETKVALKIGKILLKNKFDSEEKLEALISLKKRSFIRH